MKKHPNRNWIWWCSVSTDSSDKKKGCICCVFSWYLIILNWFKPSRFRWKPRPKFVEKLEVIGCGKMCASSKVQNFIVLPIRQGSFGKFSHIHPGANIAAERLYFRAKERGCEHSHPPRIFNKCISNFYLINLGLLRLMHLKCLRIYESIKRNFPGIIRWSASIALSKKITGSKIKLITCAVPAKNINTNKYVNWWFIFW